MPPQASQSEFISLIFNIGSGIVTGKHLGVRQQISKIMVYQAICNHMTANLNTGGLNADICRCDTKYRRKI